MTSRVVFDTRVVTGSGGGPEKTILNSPRFLAPLGYPMLCGYLHPPGDPGFGLLRDKAAELRAPLFSIPDRGPWDWRVVSECLRICRREDVGVWHGHDYKTNALGLLLARLWPMRLVTTLHGWVERTSRTPLYFRVDKLCLPHYERVVCVSPDLVTAARKAGVAKSRCVLLENGIDTDDYARRRTPAEAKRALGLPGSALVVGGVGRLSPEKGFDLLIGAFATLVEAGVDAHLVIVGEGGDRPRLEALVAEHNLGGRVRFAGWQRDARGHFEAFDVFALSSLREGLPNVLLEAMALEVPSVATNIAGVPRLLTPGRDGLLVEPGDVPGLAAALRRLAGDAGLRQSLGAAARQTVLTRYSFRQRMEALAAVYDGLLAER